MDAASASTVLNALGLPPSDAVTAAIASLPSYDSAHLSQLVTDEVAAQTWGAWNADQPHRLEDLRFRRAFRAMLAEGVSMGLSINRFRDISRRLPDPDQDAANWIPLVEEAASGRDRCSIRILLSPARFRRYTRVDAAVDPKEQWDQLVAMMRDQLFYELGIILPPFAIRSDDSLHDDEIRVEWNDLRLPPQRIIREDQAIVNDTPEAVTARLSIRAETAVNPANGHPCALIDVADRQRCEDAKLSVWDSKHYVILVVSGALRRSAGAFVNRILIDKYLGDIAQFKPELVNEVSRRLNKDVLVRIVRALVSEDISVRDMSTVLQAAMSATTVMHRSLSTYIIFAHQACVPVIRGDGRKGPVSVTEYVGQVRSELKRYISHKYTRGSNTLVVYLMDPTVEQRLAQPLPLTQDESRKLRDEVRREVGASAQTPVVLTTSDIRSRLRQELHVEFPAVAVVSYQELSPDMNIQPIARLSPDIEPYTDASFYRFVESWPGRRHAGARVPDSGRRRVLDTVVAELRRAHPHEYDEDALVAALERVLLACTDPEGSASTDALDTLCEDAGRALAVNGTNISDLVALPLLVAAAIRQRTEPDESLEPGERIRSLNHVFSQQDAASRRVATALRRAGLRTKFPRIFQ